MIGLNIRLGLGHKIFGVGAIGVIGLLTVGAIYFYGTFSVAHHQKVADEAGGAGALPTKILIQLLEMRRAEKDFLLRNDDRYAKRHGTITQSIDVNLGALTQQLKAGQQSGLVGKIDAVGSGFENYKKHFSALVDAKHKIGLNENSGLEGSLRTSVHAIETALKKFDDAPANAAMLTMRRHEKDFMLRRDVKYADQMKKAAGAFAAIVARSEFPAVAKEEIVKLLAAYQRDFAAYIDGMLIVVREQKEMSDTYAKMEPQIDGLMLEIEKIAAQASATAGTIRAETGMQCRSLCWRSSLR